MVYQAKEKTCLESPPERANAAFRRVCAKPRSVPPRDIAVAPRDYLVTTHHQLNQPHVGNHLPHDKAPLLRNRTAGGTGGRDTRQAEVMVPHRHRHFSGGKYVLHRAF